MTSKFRNAWVVCCRERSFYLGVSLPTMVSNHLFNFGSTGTLVFLDLTDGSRSRPWESEIDPTATAKVSWY